jgi:hypothetical protein
LPGIFQKAYTRLLAFTADQNTTCFHSDTKSDFEGPQFADAPVSMPLSRESIQDWAFASLKLNAGMLPTSSEYFEAGITGAVLLEPVKLMN